MHFCRHVRIDIGGKTKLNSLAASSSCSIRDQHCQLQIRALWRRCRLRPRLSVRSDAVVYAGQRSIHPYSHTRRSRIYRPLQPPIQRCRWSVFHPLDRCPLMEVRTVAVSPAHGGSEALLRGVSAASLHCHQNVALCLVYKLDAVLLWTTKFLTHSISTPLLFIRYLAEASPGVQWVQVWLYQGSSTPVVAIVMLIASRFITYHSQ